MNSNSENKKITNESIAIIGCGNIGGALLRGLVRSGSVSPDKLIACDRNVSTREELAQELGVRVEGSVGPAIAEADVIVLALKPLSVPEGLLALAPHLKSLKRDPLIVSVAGGIRVSEIQRILPAATRVSRVMPNLPCLVGYGMTGIYAPNAEDALISKRIFSALGQTIIMGEESALDVVTAVSASGVAFFFIALEALADGAVLMGLKREEAMILAAQTAYGAAAMVLQNGEHPAVLKDRVASPGGTTIAGIQALEERGFRGAWIAAVEAATSRARELAIESEGVE